MDVEFPRGVGDQVEKSQKFQIPGLGGGNMKPSGTENPVGWGVNLEKILDGVVWILFGTPHLAGLSKKCSLYDITDLHPDGNHQNIFIHKQMIQYCLSIIIQMILMSGQLLAKYNKTGMT